MVVFIFYLNFDTNKKSLLLSSTQFNFIPLEFDVYGLTNPTILNAIQPTPT